MVHRIGWRVGSTEALDFWATRLEGAGVEAESVDGALRFRDPEGLEHQLRVADVSDAPLIADHPEVPAEVALQGFDGARAFSADPERSADLLEQGLEFERRDYGWEARGSSRGGGWAYDAPPEAAGLQGAGTVHHIAWASQMDEHEAWRERASEHGARPTPVIDRFWFRSIYFREPSGVLFEIATLGSGLRHRRGSRAPGREADPAAVPRGPTRGDRGEPGPGDEPAGRHQRLSDMAEELVHRLREPAGDPAGALVLNHGRGADENDLFPLLDELDPERRLLGVTTGAPLTDIPPGGRHWYVVPRVGYPDPETFHQATDCSPASSTASSRSAGSAGSGPRSAASRWER